MALIKHNTGEVQFKIVYCGPPGGGKTTNLHYIYRRLDPHHRGDLISIATETDRTICFDFLPVLSTEIFGIRTRFQLYTVPGQEILRSTRESVLNGVDGIVFVADSSPSRFHANESAYRSLMDSLGNMGIDPNAFPLAFQYNKRDAAGAVRPEELDEAFRVRTPSFLACATSGYQVFATLDYVTQQVLKGFHASIVEEGARESKRVSREIPVEIESTV